MKYADTRLVEHLASAYVLGTLTDGARRRFEKLVRARPDLQLAVAEWEARLGRLAQSVPAVRPPPRVWRAIEARTRPQQSPTAGGAWPGWLKPAGFGLGGLAAGLIATLAMIAVAPALFFSADQAAMRMGEKLPQSYVGLLTDDKGDGKFLVSSLRHGRTMTIKVIGPVTAPAQGGRLVLWALPGDAPPFILGTAPSSGSAVSMLPDTSEKLLSKVRKLAVTAETSERPASPGAILYSGNCAKLW